MASEYSHSSAATAFRLDEVPERLKPENKGRGFDAGLKGAHYPNSENANTREAVSSTD